MQQAQSSSDCDHARVLASLTQAAGYLYAYRSVTSAGTVEAYGSLSTILCIQYAEAYDSMNSVLIQLGVEAFQ